MIFLDTNVISETMRKQPNPSVISWLESHDDLLAIPTVTIAEIAYGIAKIRTDERSKRLANALDDWRHRFSDRIYPFTEQAALIYGELMADSAHSGKVVFAPDGLIAAIAKANNGQLATRNTSDFEHMKLAIINPWD